MTDTRMLITGWRDWPESHRGWIFGHLDENMSGATVLVHGQCPKGGADLWAERWALRHGLTVERHPADWDRYGKAAGPRRNTAMVELGADLCVAFPGPGSSGTWDCVRKASDAGIRVEVCSWAEVLRLDRAGVMPFGWERHDW